MATTINAGDLSNGASISSDTSGALVLQTGAAGSKVNAVSFAADGTPTFLKQPTVTTQSASYLTSGAVAASTSGTAVEFTSIPSWVKRITVMFSAVSSNSTGTFQVQLGTSGSYEIASYTGATGAMVNTASSSVANISTGFGIYNGGNLYNIYGNATLALIDASTNLWCFSFAGANGNTANVLVGGGTKALSGTLTRLRVIASATGSPADTFDGGSINILYE